MYLNPHTIFNVYLERVLSPLKEALTHAHQHDVVKNWQKAPPPGATLMAGAKPGYDDKEPKHS